MKEYQSREYCKKTNCVYQMYLDGINVFNDRIEKLSKEEIKQAHCKSCEAYKFYQWLKDNGYKIVNKDYKEVIKEIKEIADLSRLYKTGQRELMQEILEKCDEVLD